MDVNLHEKRFSPLSRRFIERTPSQQIEKGFRKGGKKNL
jgi:hypothetical protein